jgi:hypothetical protein
MGTVAKDDGNESNVITINETWTKKSASRIWSAIVAIITSKTFPWFSKVVTGWHGLGSLWGRSLKWL